jgi:NAD(P)-dependent dehydrogenase (short-subunit alcohol dehydrogenase family)
MTDEDWYTVLAVNLSGAFFVAWGRFGPYPFTV